MSSFFSILRLSLLGLLPAAFLAGGCASGPEFSARTNGVANFSRVDGTLWRGAQPDENGLEFLKGLGAATVINLRMSGDVVRGEEAAARRLGLAYYNVPLPGLSAPSDLAVRRVLSLIASSPGPVFIHCQYGCDRTGTIVACYRIRHDGWRAARALAEAREHGMSRWEFGMIHYVRRFPAELAAAERPIEAGAWRSLPGGT